MKESIINICDRIPALYACVDADFGLARSLVRLFDSIVQMYDSLWYSLVTEAGALEFSVHFIQQVPLEALGLFETLAGHCADALLERGEVQACVLAGLGQI